MPDTGRSAYFSRDPTGTSSRKPASTGLPSGAAVAAKIMPLDSTPRNLRGAQIHDHDDFAADELLGLVGGGDAGDDLADLVADIHHQLQQLVGAGDALGGFHQADAHLDLGEIVDADARRAPRRRPRRGGRRRAPRTGGGLQWRRQRLPAGCRRMLPLDALGLQYVLFHGQISSPELLFFRRAEIRRGLADARPGWQLSPGELVDSQLGQGADLSELAPDLDCGDWAARDAPARR